MDIQIILFVKLDNCVIQTIIQLFRLGITIVILWDLVKSGIEQFHLIVVGFIIQYLPMTVIKIKEIYSIVDFGLYEVDSYLISQDT